jgi:hypothetical protein
MDYPLHYRYMDSEFPICVQIFVLSHINKMKQQLTMVTQCQAYKYVSYVFSDTDYNVNELRIHIPIMQGIIHKTIHRKLNIEQYEVQWSRNELMCSGRVSSFCSTSDIYDVLLQETILLGLKLVILVILSNYRSSCCLMRVMMSTLLQRKIRLGSHWFGRCSCFIDDISRALTREGNHT